MAEVIGLFIKGKSGAPMVALEESELLAGRGLKGQPRVRKGSKRQVLLMPAELLDEFGLQPGIVRENITTRGLDVMSLQPGDRVSINGALLEATVPCTPCEFMDEIRPGLQEASQGKRGMLFRVIEGGSIQIGDSIQVAAAEET